MESMKSVMQHAKDNSKHIFNQNVNVAKTIEQNTRDLVDFSTRCKYKIQCISKIAIVAEAILEHHQQQLPLLHL